MAEFNSEIKLPNLQKFAQDLQQDFLDNYANLSEEQKRVLSLFPRHLEEILQQIATIEAEEKKLNLDEETIPNNKKYNPIKAAQKQLKKNENQKKLKEIAGELFVASCASTKKTLEQSLEFHKKCGLGALELNKFSKLDVNPLVAILASGKTPEQLDKFLKIEGVEINAKSEISGNTAAHFAVALGVEKDVFKTLIENQLDLNVKNKSNLTVLDLAVLKGDEKTAKFLLENNAKSGVFVGRDFEEKQNKKPSPKPKSQKTNFEPKKESLNQLPNQPLPKQEPKNQITPKPTQNSGSNQNQKPVADSAIYSLGNSNSAKFTQSLNLIERAPKPTQNSGSNQNQKPVADAPKQSATHLKEISFTNNRLQNQFKNNPNSIENKRQNLDKKPTENKIIQPKQEQVEAPIFPPKISFKQEQVEAPIFPPKIVLELPKKLQPEKILKDNKISQNQQLKNQLLEASNLAKTSISEANFSQEKKSDSKERDIQILQPKTIIEKILKIKLSEVNISALLFDSVRKGDEVISALLIQYGADVSYQRGGKSVLDIAVEQKSSSLVEIVGAKSSSENLQKALERLLENSLQSSLEKYSKQVLQNHQQEILQKNQPLKTLDFAKNSTFEETQFSIPNQALNLGPNLRKPIEIGEKIELLKNSISSTEVEIGINSSQKQKSDSKERDIQIFQPKKTFEDFKNNEKSITKPNQDLNFYKNQKSVADAPIQSANHSKENKFVSTNSLRSNSELIQIQHESNLIEYSKNFEPKTATEKTLNSNLSNKPITQFQFESKSQEPCFADFLPPKKTRNDFEVSSSDLIKIDQKFANPIQRVVDVSSYQGGKKPVLKIQVEQKSPSLVEIVGVKSNSENLQKSPEKLLEKSLEKSLEKPLEKPLEKHLEKHLENPSQRNVQISSNNSNKTEKNSLANDSKKEIKDFLKPAQISNDSVKNSSSPSSSPKSTVCKALSPKSLAQSR